MRRAAPRLLHAMVLLIGLAATPLIFAITPGPLPAFTLKNSADASVDSNALGTGRNWLLIYIKESSGATQELLTFLERQMPGGVRGQIAIICGGNADLLRQLAGSHPHLARELFFHDDRGQAWNLLQMQHSPTVTGMSGRNVRWVMNGLSTTPQTWQNAVASWLDTVPGGASSLARSKRPAAKAAQPASASH